MGFKKKVFKKYAKRSLAKRIKSEVNKVVHKNIENKEIIHRLTGTFGSVPNGWTELSLANIAQGITDSTRIGRQIRVKSIDINAVVAGGAVTAAGFDDTHNTIRVILGLYHETSTPLASGGGDINDYYNKDNMTKGKMIIKLLDKFILLPARAVSSSGNYIPDLKPFKYHKYWKNGLLITWGDDTQNNPQKTLVLSMFSDSTGVPNPGILQGYCRIMYEDA